MAGIAGVVAFSGSGSASLNGDELATISAASRSLPGLWELARHIDGHFLPYYLFMQLWAQAGTAELWLRLPSALAVGVAAWFLVDLGRRLHSTWAGVTAGLLFAALPSVSYYGAFARSYAPAAAAVVFSFWALHRATRAQQQAERVPDHGREQPPSHAAAWVAYAAAVGLVCCTHLFAVLVLPAQLVAAVALLPRRTVLLRWAPAVAAGCLPALVLGLVGYGERHAISWIPQRGPEVLLKFPKMAAGSTEVGVVLFVVALAGVVLLRDRAWAGTLLGWLVLPPVLLLAVSHLVTPVYVDRYLFVAAPALALLAGIAVASVPRGGMVACCGLVVVAVAVGVPQQMEVREANGRFEDFPWAVRKVDARPGDAIVFGQSSVRAGFDYYRDGSMPDDVLRLGSAPEAEGFGFPERDDVAAALADRERVWVVWRGVKSAGQKLPRVKAVREAGYEQTGAWHSAETPGLTVALFAQK